MKKLLFCLLLVLSGQIYAASGDSVMNTPGIYMIPTTISSVTTRSAAPMGSVTTPQQDIDLCPAGMTGPSGGSTYVKRIRNVTTYINLTLNLLLGSSFSDWQDTEEECTKTETQVVPCPTGFSGTMTQQRLVISANAQFLFKDWGTILNLCVAIPLDLCDPLDLGLGLNSSFIYGGAPYPGKLLGNVWEIQATWRGVPILGDSANGNFSLYSNLADIEAALAIKGYRINYMPDPLGLNALFGIFTGSICKIR